MCVKPLTIKNKYQSPRYDKPTVTIPCGKCVKCINKKRTEWAFRLDQEAKDHAQSYFITLTYDEKELPYLNLETGQYPVRLSQDVNILRETDRVEKIVYKKDVQDFIKRLRYYQKKQTKRKIRYYACSEYGTEKTKRPHYHIIAFGLEPTVARKVELGKVWQYGNADIKPLDNKPGTYYYVTKYLFKQRLIKDTWTFKPFSLMSTRPFIGHGFIKRNIKRQYYNQDLFTKFNGKEIIIPRIYRESLMYEVDDKPDKYFKKYLKDNTIKKLQKKLKEAEEKTFRETNKNNYHPDILEAFKKITQQNKFQKETNRYKQQILKQ